MELSARDLNRATLGRQLLLAREPLKVPDAVRRVLAIQAQSPASPYVALWNRLGRSGSGFDPAELDACLADATVVKATLMRVTLHAVHRDDWPALHGAMVSSLRRARLGDPRFTMAGMSITAADALLPSVLGFAAEPRTGAELEALLGRPVWWAMRTYAPLWHAVAPGPAPWSFTAKGRYAASPVPDVTDEGAAIRRLVLRYLAAFGPASAADVAQFTLLQRPVVRAALAALGDEVQMHCGPAGLELYDVPGGLLPGGATPAPARLMAMWDSVLLAYADRSRMIPPDYRRLVLRRNGDVLPTLLVDGFVAGVWRTLADGRLEATAFHPLPAAAWAELTTEALGLTALLAGREPVVYARHHHWYDGLPAAEVRVLTG